MLWTCKLISPGLWSFILSKICRKLFGQPMKWLRNKQCPNYSIPECNLFGHKINEIKFQEALYILKDLKDEFSSWTFFWQNYLIRAIRSDCVLHEQNKSLDINLIHYKLSIDLNDNRESVRLLKQHLCDHRITAANIQCYSCPSCHISI